MVNSKVVELDELINFAFETFLKFLCFHPFFLTIMNLTPMARVFFRSFLIKGCNYKKYGDSEKIRNDSSPKRLKSAILSVFQCFGA